VLPGNLWSRSLDPMRYPTRPFHGCARFIYRERYAGCQRRGERVYLVTQVYSIRFLVARQASPCLRAVAPLLLPSGPGIYRDRTYDRKIAATSV